MTEQQAGPVRVVDNPDRHRFEVRVGETVAGIAAYRLTADRIVFTHTRIYPAFEGQGLGSRLAGDALDAARQRNLTIVPQCPFIAAYLARHPE